MATVNFQSGKCKCYIHINVNRHKAAGFLAFSAGHLEKMSGHKICSSYRFPYSEIVWTAIYAETCLFVYKQYSSLIA